VPERALSAATPRPPIRAVPRQAAAPLPPEPVDPALLPHRQNGMGDVVIPVDRGEIVALPRLWDFDLERIDGDAAVLTTDSGLIAVVSFLSDTAVVTGVTAASDGSELEIA
jgi:hypothetical protein